MALHGSKRASREEMSKVERAEPLRKFGVVVDAAQKWDKPLLNWAEEMSKLDSVEGARGLYALAKAEHASEDVLTAITALGKTFTLEGK